MEIHAAAIPLNEPLPGGSQGANVVIEPMITGTATWPPAWPERETGPLARMKGLGIGVPKSRYETVPIPAFLVRHPSAGLILIDTGLHASVATDPKLNMGRFAKRFMNFAAEQDEDVPAQLRQKGLDPRDIAIVVLTHLHSDHASAISEFPNSTFVLAASEWDAATMDKRPWLRGYRPEHFNHAFDYRLVDFETEDPDAPIESYGTFGRTFDLLGDGSVRLAYTPGHSAGHMSVVLRLPRRDFVVGGDAIYHFAQLENAPPPARMVDEHAWKRSLQELKLFHTQYPYAVITPGHDPEFYAKLEPRYEE